MLRILFLRVCEMPVNSIRSRLLRSCLKKTIRKCDAAARSIRHLPVAFGFNTILRTHPAIIRPSLAPLCLTLFLGLALADNPAPVFHLDDVDGKSFNLNENLGKEVVLIDFWATFCVPCLTEMDTYRELQIKFHERGLHILAVSVDQPQTAARVRSFAKAKNFPFTVLLDPEQQAYRLYNVSVLPTLVLVDGSGHIVYRKEGFEPGDEKELEKRIVELLPPVSISTNAAAKDSSAKISPAPASATPLSEKGLLTGVNLSGSNFLRANYGKESPDVPDPNGWLEDWFDFRIASDRLSYQARFRAYQFLNDNTIRNPTDRVVKQTFAYENDHADVRAGNIYGNLNQGLVLHFFEDRQARIDKDMKGVWGSLQGGSASATPGWGHGRVSVFGGNTYSNFTDLYSMDAEEDALRNVYLQGLEGEWEPLTGVKAGAQYLEAFRTNWHVKLVGVDAQWLSGPTSLYLAYVGLEGHDAFNYPNDYHGRALYGSLSENLGAFELGGEVKYYYNYDLGFTDPPSLVKYQTFRLMARDMLFPNNQGEQGLQLHGTWHFAGQDFYSANLSSLLSHPERNPTYLVSRVELPYMDLNQTLQLARSKQGTILLDLDWNRQRKFDAASFQDVNAFTAGVNATKPLFGPWILQGEVELQRQSIDSLLFIQPDAAAGKLGNVGSVFGHEKPWQGVLSATLGRNSAWTFTLDYEFTTSKSQQDSSSGYRLPGTKGDWVSAYFTLSALQGNQISLWYGQRRERVICSGGSCRLEPAFEGAELIWISHF